MRPPSRAFASCAYTGSGVRPPASASQARPRARMAPTQAASSASATCATSAPASAWSCSIQAIAAPSLFFAPAVAVAFGQRDRRRRAPGAGRVGTRGDAGGVPAVGDRVHPAPGGLGLVAAHEQGAVALDRVQVQALVGDPAALVGELLVEVQVQADLRQ